MRDNKSILHVVNIYFVLPFFIGNQFQYFKNKGYKMNVVCSPSEYLAGYAQRQGFDYFETPVNRSISLMSDLKTIFKICRFINQKNIGIIVGHTPKGALLAMVAGWLCRVPKRFYFRHGLVYETSHGVKRFLLKSVDRLASFCSTQIVCVSPSVLQKSIEDKLADKDKQILLGRGTCNGIDTQGQFNPKYLDAKRLKELKAKYGIQDDDFVIGYSGRLVKDKGIVDLVSALDKLENERYKLLLVGMFEERDALPLNIQNRIKSDDRIIYTGFINGGMEYYYAMMNVYVLASYREGFPTGVLEAQSMEIPVITTEATGCCDSIVNGKTGLFTTHDPSDIASKIDTIRCTDTINGKEGRKWVVDNFDSHIVWREIEKLY